MRIRFLSMKIIPKAPWDREPETVPCGFEYPPPSAPVDSEYSFQMPGWHVWCGSIVKNQTTGYTLFFSCWPEKHNHEGWVTHSEIWRAEGPEPWGPYTNPQPVLSASRNGSWDAHNFHNVTVRRFGGKYFMYYTGNYGNGDWWVHRNNQRIGVAVADAPEGPWRRGERPLIDISEDSWDSLCVANPTVCEISGGGYVMIYKGVTAGDMPFGSRVLHGFATSANPDGPFEKGASRLFEVPGIRFPFEDPHIWRDGETYHCLLKDMVGMPGSTKRSILAFHSRDPRDWNTTDFEVVSTPQIRESNGRIHKMERLERPSYFQDGEKRCVTLAAKPEGPGLSFIVFHRPQGGVGFPWQ